MYSVSIFYPFQSSSVNYQSKNQSSLLRQSIMSTQVSTISPSICLCLCLCHLQFLDFICYCLSSSLFRSSSWPFALWCPSQCCVDNTWAFHSENISQPSETLLMICCIIQVDAVIFNMLLCEILWGQDILQTGQTQLWCSHVSLCNSMTFATI